MLVYYVYAFNSVFACRLSAAHICCDTVYDLFSHLIFCGCDVNHRMLFCAVFCADPLGWERVGDIDGAESFAYILHCLVFHFAMIE